LSGSGGFGFLARIEHLMSRQKAGKSFLSLNAGETPCKPSLADGSNASIPMAAATHVCCASTAGRILTFEMAELKLMEKGGRGLTLMDLDAKDTLAGAAAYVRSVRLKGLGRGGKEREETLEIRSLNNARGGRARKGKAADLGFKPTEVIRVE
jgi:topoisomerase-4 subunit A